MSNDQSLSVIIPTYNCAQWLERAVWSTQHLGVPNPEVFIIDDGSTDETITLGPRLAEEIPGVKYFRKPNGGLSSARNYGIERATGAYILLLDSDDELIPCNISPALATGADMLRIGVEELLNGVPVRLHQDDKFDGSGESYLKCKFEEESFYTPSWAYLYRRQWLVTSGIKFVPGLIHEDNLFTVQTLLSAHRVVSFSDVVYRYMRREGSITTSGGDLKRLQRIKSLAYIARQLIDMANHHDDIDMRYWIEKVVDYAYSIALRSKWRRCKLGALQIQLIYMTIYTGFDGRRVNWHNRDRFKRFAKSVLRNEIAVGESW